MQGGAKLLEDEVVYAFMHAVVHEVVHEVVPNARRLVDDDDDGDAVREFIADELGASGANLIG